MKKSNILCYVAAKSGGHIIPCLTLAEEEIKKHPNTQILFFTSPETADQHIADFSSHITWHIPLPLQSASVHSFYQAAVFLGQLIATLVKTSYYLIAYRPKKVVSTGSFLAIPVTIIARMLAIPVELYELNVQPGKATTLLAHWSVDLRICFTQTEKYFPKKKCKKVAYPIRFFDDTKQISQREALETLQFCQKRKTICILGGSQGSIEINNVMRTWIMQNKHFHNQIQIIHQIGNQDSFDWRTFYAQYAIQVKLFNFCFDLALYYSAADLIISRAGSGTLFETLFFWQTMHYYSF